MNDRGLRLLLSSAVTEGSHENGEHAPALELVLHTKALIESLSRYFVCLTITHYKHKLAPTVQGFCIEIQIKCVEALVLHGTFTKPRKSLDLVDLKVLHVKSSRLCAAPVYACGRV